VERRNKPTYNVSQTSLDEELQFLKWQLQKQTSPRKSFRLQALQLIKKVYLPQLTQAELRESSLFSWIPIICELPGESDALDYSLLTFCVVLVEVALNRMGTICVDDYLQSYNDTIQKLLVELEHDDAGQRDELLAVISVLSTYEVLLVAHNLSTQNANRSRYLFSLQIIPGQLIPKDYQKFYAYEVAWILHHRCGEASAHAFESFSYIYLFF
jgi:hypothetical protein